MLPKKNRLSEERDFEELKKAGKIAPGRFFGLLKKENGIGVTRFGFIVSTKVSKKAVERNRVKRLLRASCRNLLKEVKEGFDFLLLAKKNLSQASQEQVQEDLKTILEKENLCK